MKTTLIKFSSKARARMFHKGVEFARRPGVISNLNGSEVEVTDLDAKLNEGVRGYDEIDWTGDWWEDELRKTLAKRSSGGWEYDSIDCCYSGKDADLTPEGNQGVELVSCDREGANLIAHCYSLVTGDDVCLNFSAPGLEEDSDEHWEEYNKAREWYLEQAEAVVEGTGLAGEWDGCDWGMTLTEDFSVALIKGKRGKPYYEQMADKIEYEFNKIVASFEEEMRLANLLLDQLAGWKDGEGKAIKDGDPCPLAAWSD